MVEQHEAATGPSRKQQTPEAIAENSELLGKPQALRHFGWLLADMTAEETIAAAARQEIRRLKEAGLADEEAFGRVLLRLTLEGPGLVPALLCGTRENDAAVELALTETRQLFTRGRRRRWEFG